MKPSVAMGHIGEQGWCTSLLAMKRDLTPYIAVLCHSQHPPPLPGISVSLFVGRMALLTL